MSLQDTFYIFGIIAMILFIVATGFAIFLMIYIRKKIFEAERAVVNKIVEYTKPVDVVKGLSASILGNIFLRLQDRFNLR